MDPPSPATLRAVERLQTLTDLFALRRRQLAAEADLTEAQWRVLEEIATDHFLPSMFARIRDCSAAAVSRTLRQLQERGLVRAQRDREDARQRRYALTVAGRRRLERIRRARHHALAVAWDDVDDRELERFVRFAGPLIERLQTLAREPREIS